VQPGVDGSDGIGALEFLRRQLGPAGDLHPPPPPVVALRGRRGRREATRPALAFNEKADALARPCRGNHRVGRDKRCEASGADLLVCG
jgi:hypothetical protein